LRAIEVDGSALAGLVEVIDLGLPELAAEVHLVRSFGPAQIVIQMTCDVISP
jgi:hypothetical protein